MMKGISRKKIWWGGVFLVTSVLFVSFYQQRSQDLLTDIAPGYDDGQKQIPLFGQNNRNGIENFQEIPYIDSENETKQERRLPNALVVGVRKGGTRAVLDFLSRHPSVKACPREVHFFDQQENYKRGLDWYREQMPLSFPNEMTIEKSPAYYVTDGVPKKVFEMSPSTKLLVVVRDPTIRAISDYAQIFDNNKGALKQSFESYITEDPEHRVLRKRSPLITIGMYANHLNKWLQYFPREQVHFISGEELVRNPANEMKSVELFLGLKPFINERLFYYNSTKGFLCLTPVTPNRSGCLSDTKGRPHPSVDEGVITLLRDFYRPLNEKFYTATGRDFGWN
ncbi:heparan sulfate glucosamine 3-O-sulfotransferase 1-like [Acropora muricata]|uniref:heparan sulfate glucosamine 3-O-sulfotransferase 1-like n=1 Tax=Acropora millepora TaxID=45264 RepID=UPI001CF47629|nr:heparan sulfate glucosamine 3-O-sulfotransferase 1-like [Acropora millepora]XP_029201811.2 heparan sulfate glucosamine 3-O-sulfotransferase 1-like [Acropora millepora]XP_044175294.1 heparan sulfate glucosamine 3-O-sulfotransferase 1-like [Acropora millepora]XP_044175303.1 heparan sulfate glucosamine 3-O-sulfotransferase 1-like [Acropora millepora]